MTERDWKLEAVRQWNADPCGSDDKTPFGTREFFAEVERYRYEVYAPWMKEAIGFEQYAGRRLLEVGFGLGTDHVSFARGGASCYGLDLTPAHISATKTRFLQEGFAPRLVRGDAEGLPFREGYFDVVYSFGVLHHTPRTQEAIDEVHRVLVPGGEAIVALYHRDSLFYWGSIILDLGLRRRGFFRDGYRKTISRIEKRGNSDAVPLVKVYGVNEACRLFRRFAAVKAEVRHLGYEHGGRLGGWLERLPGPCRRWIERRMGWYVIIRARKETAGARG